MNPDTQKTRKIKQKASTLQTISLFNKETEHSEQMMNKNTTIKKRIFSFGKKKIKNKS